MMTKNWKQLNKNIQSQFEGRDCLVLLSGGQDSTTCLMLAKKYAKSVEAITFDYGQRNQVENNLAVEVCKKNKIPIHIQNINAIMHNQTVSYVKGSADPIKGGSDSWVVHRNLLLITLAHIRATVTDKEGVVLGINSIDTSGYPDCGKSFADRASVLLSISAGSYRNPLITPLLHLTKHQIWRLADEGGFLDTIIKDTITCYNGEETMNEWGYGCGECSACKIRKDSYYKYKGDLK